MRTIARRVSWATLLVTLAGGAAAEAPVEHYGHHMWGGGWFFGPLMMIAMLAIVVAVVVLTVRWLGGPGHGHAQPPAAKTPLDILEVRFARGEIDTAEFEERRRALGQ
jgi:putative membrane protein